MHNIDRNTKQAILLALYNLKDNGPINRGFGICFNLSELMPEVDRIVGYSFVSQVAKHYGLPSLAPVSYLSHKMLMSGEYDHLPIAVIDYWDKNSLEGQARYKFLDMCINYLEEL